MADVQQQRKSNLGGITGKGFMPGQSGNPGGRPKGPSLKHAVERRLGEIAPAKVSAALGLPETTTWCDVLAETTVRAAVGDEAQARRLVWEYMEGAPLQSIDMTTHREDRPSLEEMFAELDSLRSKALEKVPVEAKNV